MEKRFVYLDNAATTAVSKPVLDAMMPYLTTYTGNPSSLYSVGRDARTGVEKAREQVAKALNCRPNEIYFVGCGSEADNWAIKGAALAGKAKGKTKIVTSCFEHHAVLHSCRALEKENFQVVYLPVTPEGIVDMDAFRREVTEDCALVSIMYANNEIGTIQPIDEMAALCREKKVLFHTDAVQAVGHLPISLADSDIDMLSLSGHKFHAPKGIGALYIRTGVRIPNLIDGGAQERGRRAGTENVPGIVGLGEAITRATDGMEEREARMKRLRDRLIKGLSEIEMSRVNGSLEHRLAGNVNMSFVGAEGESLLLMLDMYGICASSGSACTSGSLDPSHVLMAIGLRHEVAHGSLRLSLSEETTDKDIDYVLETVPMVVKKLRSMSPLWERIQSGELKF